MIESPFQGFALHTLCVTAMHEAVQMDKQKSRESNYKPDIAYRGMIESPFQGFALHTLCVTAMHEAVQMDKQKSRESNCSPDFSLGQPPIKVLALRSIRRVWRQAVQTARYSTKHRICWWCLPYRTLGRYAHSRMWFHQS